MILDSQNFTYNNQLSTTFNVSNVKIPSGLAEEELIGDQEIEETTVRGRSKPYFHGLKQSPKTIKMTINFDETWTEDSISAVIDWLFSPTYYVPLIFSELTSRVFYVLPIGSVPLAHNCLNQGYIDITFRTNDHYGYSPEYSVTYDLVTNSRFIDGLNVGNFNDAEYL